MGTIKALILQSNDMKFQESKGQRQILRLSEKNKTNRLKKNETLDVQMVVVYSLSHVRLYMISWTVALQAPSSMGFSRHEYTGVG